MPPHPILRQVLLPISKPSAPASPFPLCGLQPTQLQQAFLRDLTSPSGRHCPCGGPFARPETCVWIAPRRCREAWRPRRRLPRQPRAASAGLGKGPSALWRFSQSRSCNASSHLLSIVEQGPKSPIFSAPIRGPFIKESRPRRAATP